MISYHQHYQQQFSIEISPQTHPEHHTTTHILIINSNTNIINNNIASPPSQGQQDQNHSTPRTVGNTARHCRKMSTCTLFNTHQSLPVKALYNYEQQQCMQFVGIYRISFWLDKSFEEWRDYSLLRAVRISDREKNAQKHFNTTQLTRFLIPPKISNNANTLKHPISLTETKFLGAN